MMPLWLIKSNTSVSYKGVLSYGRPSYGRFVKPPKFGVNKLVSKQYLPGAHAYLISPKAAKVLVATAGREPEPTDVYINNQRFDFVEEYYPWPVEVMDEFSTVQNRRGVMAKHGFQKDPNNYRLLDA
jgi:GR25 family glycosyltransferase involved in LPS biosynthesis